jgi:hypothetical protein
MSAYYPIPDIFIVEIYVCEVPLADIKHWAEVNLYGPPSIRFLLLNGNNDGDFGATLTAPLNINKASIREGFERPALGEAIHAPTVQVKVRN